MWVYIVYSTTDKVFLSIRVWSEPLGSHRCEVVVANTLKPSTWRRRQLDLCEFKTTWSIPVKIQSKIETESGSGDSHL